MNAKDLHHAHNLWRALKEEPSRQVAKTALASQIRTTGLESTLRWLETKSAPLRDELCKVLEIPTDRQARAKRTNLQVLSDNRRALALAEALHLIARAR